MPTKSILPDSIVCDSSSLISLSDTCFIPVLYFLNERLKGNFIISPSVKNEIIDRAVGMKSHALSALRLKKALGDGVMLEARQEVGERMDYFKKTANNLFYVFGKPVTLIHGGEAEMIAIGAAMGVRNMLIDERTTRMLIESPMLLKQHMESEFRLPIKVNMDNLRTFRESTEDMNLFRSSELVAIAYEHGYFNDYGETKKDALRAALHALKFSGCSLSFSEIDSFMDSVE